MVTTKDVLLVFVKTIPDRGKETPNGDPVKFFQFPGAVGQTVEGKSG